MKAPMANDEIFSALRTIIVEALYIDAGKIRPESRLFDDLGAESLDILDIRFRIERAFGFKIEDREIISSLGKELSNAQIRERLTVESVVQFIRQRLAQQVEKS